MQDKHGKSILMHACIKNQINIIEDLSIDQNIDPNICDNEGNTCLHHSAALGHARVVQTMIERFPNLQIDKVNKLGQSALIRAAIQGKIRCAQLLLKAGADPQKRDFSRKLCAIEWAKLVGRSECVEAIANYMVEPCKHRENKLPKASDNLKQVACLIAIPIIGGDNLPVMARPRVRSAPPIPIVKITPSDGKFIKPHKVVRPTSSMA